MFPPRPAVICLLIIVDEIRSARSQVDLILPFIIHSPLPGSQGSPSGLPSSKKSNWWTSSPASYRFFGSWLLPRRKRAFRSSTNGSGGSGGGAPGSGGGGEAGDGLLGGGDEGGTNGDGDNGMGGGLDGGAIGGHWGGGRGGGVARKSNDGNVSMRPERTPNEKETPSNTATMRNSHPCG